MNISVILDLVLSVQLSKTAIECAKEFLSKSQTVLLAVHKNNPVFPVESLNSTFIVINEDYNVHYQFTSLHVNSAVVFLGCLTNSTILWTIKRNRLISVKMKLLLVVDVRCQSFSASLDYLLDIARIVGPACSGIIAYNGPEENFHWAWSHGLKNHTSHSGSIDPKQCQVAIPGVRDFKDHDFKVSASPQEPYVLDPNSEGEFEQGLEVEIIRNIVKAIGMKLKWVQLPPNEPARLLLNAKNEYVGMIGVLHRLESDIVFGGISCQAGRFYAAELMTAHTDDTLLWSIPSAPEANNLGAIFSVFSFTMWFLVMSSIFLFAFVISLKNRLKKLPRNLLQSLGILFDQGVSLKSHRHLFFWILFVFYCLVITNAYRSSLITAMTSKSNQDWFETPEEAVAAGEVTYLTPGGMPLFQETAVYDPMWRTILKPDRNKAIADYSYLKVLSETRHGITLCIRYPCLFSIYRNRLFGRDLKPSMIFLEKRFLQFPASMFMAPGSVLQPIVDLRILWLKEGGLIDHWLGEMQWQARLTALYENFGGFVAEGPTKLSLLHLRLTFYVYALFLGIGFVVFLVECIVFYFFIKSEKK